MPFSTRQGISTQGKKFPRQLSAGKMDKLIIYSLISTTSAELFFGILNIFQQKQFGEGEV
jgi:hypothetical protein